MPEYSTNAHALPTATVVGWLSLAQLASWGSVFYAFSLLMAPVEQALGLSRTETSAALSLALLAEGMAAYTVGRWIDAGHERAVMTGGSLLASACLLAHSQVQGLVGYCLTWSGLGVAMAATLYTPAFAVLTRRYPADFRRKIITLTFLGGLASTVFIPLMAWLMAAWGWRTMLVVMAGVQALLCAPIHAWVLRGAPQPHGPAHPQGCDSATRPRAAHLTNFTVRTTGTDGTKATIGAPGQASHSVRQALRSPAFALVGVFVVLMMGVSVAIAGHLVNLLRESGLDERSAVLLPAAIGVVQVVGRSLLYGLEHRVGVHTANRWTPALIPLGLLALLLALPTWSGQWAAAVVFVGLYGLGNGLLTIVKGTAMAQYVSRQHAATLNGALGLPTALGRACAPWLLGALWSPQHGYLLGLVGLLLASLVALAALVGAQRMALLPP